MITLSDRCRRRWPPARPARRQAERRDDHRRSRVARARGRRRQGRGRGARARATRIRTSSSRSPASSSSCSRADLLIVVGPRARDRLAAAADHAEPQREDPAGRRRDISTRRERADSRDPAPGRSRARWATCIRWAIRTTGSIRTTAGASRRRFATSCPNAPADAAYFDQRYADFDKRLDRGREALGCARWRPTRARRSSRITARGRTSRNASASTSSATSSRSRAFRRRRRTRSI